MRKVLVVDDEKLVRRGIMSTFPWEKHGFVVAGEAAGVESALEFVRRDPPDLVFTDLTMPGLSGFDLIRALGTEFPAVATVVLTCHDSFQYLQEAMRMGVLDYIVKTELEDEVLDRSLARISEKLGLRGFPEEVAAPKLERGVLICARGAQWQRGDLMPVVLSSADGQRLLEVDPTTWFLPLLPRQTDTWESLIVAYHQELVAFEPWVFALVTGLPGSFEAALPGLERLRSTGLFYAWNGRQNFLRLAWVDAELTATNVNLTSWFQTGWVLSDQRFEALLAETRRAVWDRGRLCSHFDAVALEWDRLLCLNLAQELHSLAESLLFWTNWEHWLIGLRDRLLGTLRAQASPSTAQSILEAIDYLRLQPQLNLGADEVAWQQHMSRSYFCQCFRKVTGQSFGTYLGGLRLDRAKALLLAGSEPIGRIADECGFRDRRYFSRVFRAATGFLPTEYRRVGGPEV